MGLGRLLEACQVHEKVALEHSSKSTKYELEGSYGDPVHEHFSFLKTAKLPRECNEGALMDINMYGGCHANDACTQFLRRAGFSGPQ